MQDPDYEGWGWTPADADDEVGAKTKIRMWFDNDLTMKDDVAPHAALATSDIGRSLLHRARLTVCDRVDDAEEARFWLAGLGLIPDPYPPAADPRIEQRKEQDRARKERRRRKEQEE